MPIYNLKSNLKTSEDTSVNFYIHINYKGMEKWVSFSPFLALIFEGTWSGRDLQKEVPAGGSAFFDKRGNKIFLLQDFKGYGLEQYKVGKRGQGLFADFPIALVKKEFDWELESIT